MIQLIKICVQTKIVGENCTLKMFKMALLSLFTLMCPMDLLLWTEQKKMENETTHLHRKDFKKSIKGNNVQCRFVIQSHLCKLFCVMSRVNNTEIGYLTRNKNMPLSKYIDYGW